MAQTIAPQTAPVPTVARPSRLWMLPALAWAIAVALGGTLAWAVPTAAEADRLADRIAVQGEETGAVAGDAARAKQELIDARAALTKAKAERAHLERRIRSESAAARKLRARIRALNAQIAQLEAAAAAASTPPAEPSIQPLEFEFKCFYRIDPSTGEKEEVC